MDESSYKRNSLLLGIDYADILFFLEGEVLFLVKSSYHNKIILVSYTENFNETSIIEIKMLMSDSCGRQSDLFPFQIWFC